MTIRDAHSMLRKNLLYHRYLGVERFFVYSDGTRDGSCDSILDIPGVTVHPSFQEPDSQVPERQEKNASDAVRRATEEDYRWLVHLDADELLCLAPTCQEPRMLENFLARLPPQIEAVRFLPFESLPTSPDPDHPFTTPWFARRGNLNQQFHDPFQDQQFTVRGLLGHTAGKTAVRLSVRPEPFYVHDFHGPEGRILTEIACSYLCHFYNPGYSGFRAKWANFAERPDHYACGSIVRFQKRLWRDFFNSTEFSEEYKRRYYEENLVFKEQDLTNGSFRRQVVRIDSVRDVFRTLGPTV